LKFTDWREVQNTAEHVHALVLMDRYCLYYFTKRLLVKLRAAVRGAIVYLSSSKTVSSRQLLGFTILCKQMTLTTKVRVISDSISDRSMDKHHLPGLN
jgi:hypothetical protein